MIPAVQEFQQNKDHVKETVAFFSSPAGIAFSKALKKMSPLELLTSEHNYDVANTRDLALAEQGSSDKLLGQVLGYHLCRKAMWLLRESTPTSPKKEKISKAGKVSNIMTQTVQE